ncbi:MAG: DUF4209 domain-containing protein [Fimbriimonadaceae bacterium]|nr:DUF4209 domain-containing protein [Fimbriimonadaceae bacterium]
MEEHTPEAPKLMFKDLHVTADDLRVIKWLDTIEFKERDKIDNYSTPLFDAARVAAEAEDRRAEQVYVLLGSASSMFYDSNDAAEPLKPMIVMANSRSAALSDFEDQHLDPIAAVYTEIADREMKARLADILWIRRKDHQAARVATAAYLEGAKAVMDHAEWVHGFNRLQRAMQIAAALGKESTERNAVADYALELLAKLDGSDPLYLTRSIIDLALEYKIGDPALLAGYAEKSAEGAEGRQDWITAADYWALVATCRRKSGNEADATEASLRQGEAQISVGEAMAWKPGLAAEHWFEQGLLTLRQAGAPKERQDELMKRLHALQKDRLEHLGKIETSVPMDPKLIEHIEKVKGMSLREALAFWAIQVRPIRKERLREMVREHVTQSPLSSIFSNSILREDGKVDFVIPAMKLNEEPSDELLQLHMWRMAEMTRPVTAWMAEQIRHMIAGEHQWEEGCLDWLLNDNLFVPKGREPIFSRGLQAAIEGDYIVATHLLIPQLENSFRHVLNQHGVLTTFLRQDGTQDEFPLNKVVETEAFSQVFGEDLAFDLRWMLAKRAGANLRNNVSHGLVSAGSFYSPSNIILVPLTLWLLLQSISNQEDGKSEGTES